MTRTPEGLQFYPEEHLYFYDGLHVPSVTQVLEPYTGLQWADPDALKAAQEFGTHVHEACHLYDIGTLDYDAMLADEPNGSVLSYLHGWIQFVESSGFVVLESEEMVYNERLKYAGTFDRIGMFPDKKRKVQIDIKTGASMPRTVGPQTAAYNEAMGERFPRYCCLLTPDNFSLHPLTDPADFSIFRAALTLHRWRHQ